MLQRLLQDAVECFRGGRLHDAKRHLREVLAIDKQHFAALHLLGVTEAQLGRPAAGAKLLETAIQLNPRSSEALNNLGMVLYRLGRNNDAAVRFRAALALDPSYALAQNNLGIALSELGSRAEARAAFVAALLIKPDYPEALSNYGAELIAARRYEEAREVLTKALAAKRDYPEAELNLANALAELSRHEEAIAHFERALELKADLAPAAIGLGNLLNMLQRFKDALPRCQRACELAPDNGAAQLAFGVALAGLGRHKEARLRFEHALVIQPNLAAAETHLGATLVALARHEEALQHLTRAIALRPDDPDAKMQFGMALASLNRHDEAIAHYHHALQLRPGFAEAQVNLARSLRALGDYHQAIALLKAAILAAPDMAAAYDNLGIALAEMGNINEACAAFDKAIALGPERPLFIHNRTVAGKIGPCSPHRAAMESMVANLESLSEEDQMFLHFALGNTLSTDDPERAFALLLRGNAIKRSTFHYDEKAALNRFQEAKRVFTAALMDRLKGQGNPSCMPIFILGMPRSGSTLVEQLLASHPNVFAGGERRDFREAMRATHVGGAPLKFPYAVATLDPAQLRELGTDYISRLVAAQARGSQVEKPVRRVTDKMPANFRFVGLIHLALPNARIIHTCRDPADTCLSCFSIHFAGSQPFAYDLGELGRYYRGYAELMAHWQRVLPQGAILNVQYEELVGNFAQEAARILAHCGLDWDDRCMSFHQTERPVATASMGQVRQPLYQSAVRRWRLSEETLRPLLAGLGVSSGTCAPQPVLE